MTKNDDLLVDLPLIPDPYSDQEMGPGEADTITDEEIKGCRLILVRRAATPVRIKGIDGGAVALLCTFHQPTPEARFTRARMSLRLTAPEGIRIIDLQPRLQVGEPVKVTINSEGKLGFNYVIVEAEGGRSRSAEFEKKHCALQGSGENTALARWDFTEDPERQSGIVHEQTLVLTLPVTGMVQATLSLSARLVRAGLRGRLSAIRDLVIGGQSGERHYPLVFEIPSAPPSETIGFFYIIKG